MMYDSTYAAYQKEKKNMNVANLKKSLKGIWKQKQSPDWVILKFHESNQPGKKAACAI